jgi:hypothetical protein
MAEADLRHHNRGERERERVSGAVQSSLRPSLNFPSSRPPFQRLAALGQRHTVPRADLPLPLPCRSPAAPLPHAGASHAIQSTVSACFLPLLLSLLSGHLFLSFVRTQTTKDSTALAARRCRKQASKKAAGTEYRLIPGSQQHHKQQHRRPQHHIRLRVYATLCSQLGLCCPGGPELCVTLCFVHDVCRGLNNIWQLLYNVSLSSTCPRSSPSSPPF